MQDVLNNQKYVQNIQNFLSLLNLYLKRINALSKAQIIEFLRHHIQHEKRHILKSPFYQF